MFASTVDFCPSGQTLVHLAVNILKKHPLPRESFKSGETEAAYVSSSGNPQTGQNKCDNKKLETRCSLLPPVSCIHSGDSGCPPEDLYCAGEGDGDGVKMSQSFMF